MTDETKESRSLEKLGERLREARNREKVETGRAEQRAGGPNSGAGLGLRIAIELVAGIVVGVAIGFALDRWLGSRPWFMVVFLFLGAAAGVMNVYRAAKGIDASIGLGEAQRRQEQDRKNGT